MLFAVDASTSHGIGVIFGHSWESWQLLPGWRTCDKDISWGEVVTIELGLCLLITLGHHNAHFILKSDNTSIRHALEGSQSRNLQQNRVLQHIVVLMCTHNIWLTFKYTPSTNNPADPPSRGLAPPSSSHILATCFPPIHFPLCNLIAWCSPL